MMWSEKYRPRNMADMVGNEEARAAVTEWFAKWKKGTKPVLLVGPPGTGKTTIAGIAAKRFGYDMIGLNASDTRSKSSINEILSPVLGSASVAGAPPMIFVDEVDGIHGRSDYGGADALIRILKEATVPIVLAANRDDSAKMKGIIKAAKTVRFRPLPPRLLRLYVRSILEREGASMGPGTLIRILNDSRGDIRSILNSAQAQVLGFNPPTEKSFETLNVEEGVNAFFKARTAREARLVLYSLRTDPREKINAFYSSIITSTALPPTEMSRMLQAVSEADMLYGRIIRTQNWRLLRYLDSVLLNLYAEGTPARYAQYNLPWPLLNRIRWDGAKLRSLCAVLGGLLHASRSTVATFHLPLVLALYAKDGEGGISPALRAEYGELLDKEAAPPK